MALPLLLFAAGVGLKAGSSILQGRQAYETARAEYKWSKRQAGELDADARAQAEKTKFDQIRQLQFGQQVMGDLLARLGASGARLDVGTPMALLIDQASELRLENMLIGLEGRTEEDRIKSQAASVRYSGRMALSQGKSARNASYLAAGGSLLQDFADGRSEGLFGTGGPKKANYSESLRKSYRRSSRGGNIVRFFDSGFDVTPR